MRFPKHLLASAFITVATLTPSMTVPVEGQGVSGSDLVSEDVVAFTTAFEGAVRAYDVDAWASMVSHDVVMMAPNGRVIEGRDAFRALWSRSFEGASGPNPLSLRIQGTKRAGNMVAVRLDYGPEGANPVGRYVWILERNADGQLRLAWWIFTSGA